MSLIFDRAGVRLYHGDARLLVPPLEVWAWAGPPFPPLWRRYGCRPAQLRRCLLGLPVSARGAGRILAAVASTSLRR